MGLRLKKTLVALAGLAVLALYIYRRRAVFSQIAVVLLLALAFTATLSPLCRRLEHRGLSPSRAAALCVAALLLVIAVIASAFVPYLVAHSVDLVRRITPTLAQLLTRLGDLAAEHGVHTLDKGVLMEPLASSMTSLTARIAKSGVALARQTGMLALSMVMAFYMLRERTTLMCHFLLCLPVTWRPAFLSAVLGCKNALLGYLSGVIKTSLFVGAATFAGLLLLGVRDALLLGLFMGIFEILPYIGPVLAAIPILLVTLPQGLPRALAGMAIVVLVQQVEGNFISPYFTASSTSIHPLLALVSVFVFGSLFGLWGILLAIPAVVTFRSLLWSAAQARTVMNP